MGPSNKQIHRPSGAGKIFDQRTLEKDYATLVPILRSGMKVLDVGCGTGAISSGIARKVGETGFVLGIDNTEAFITSGQSTYSSVSNLVLMHADLFQFETTETFDMVVAARTLQWLSNPREAIRKLSSFLKPRGILSVLDYNHEALEWKPSPPASMQVFYRAFLKWRSDSGMDNRIADSLPAHFRALGFENIEVLNANEVYRREEDDFIQRVGIWAKVAELKQIVEEGYLSEAARLQAIREYNEWIQRDAREMTMILKEVRAFQPIQS